MPAEQRNVASPTVPFLVWGLVLVSLSCALGAWVLAQGNGPFAVDAWWNGVLAGAEGSALSSFSLVMAFLGGGWFAVLVVPLGGALVLLLLRRPWSAAYFILAQAASAALVQVLKRVFGRDRPEDIIIITDFGSFPSGHVAGAATLATALVVLFPRVAVLILGVAWVLLMALSRTVLHAHWLSDTAGGALLGTGAALIVAAAMWRLLAREEPRPSLAVGR
ncbi:phosphatase PAP2 family protein [Microbacterium sp. NPDC055357]